MGVGAGRVRIRIAKVDAPHFTSNPIILLQVDASVRHRPKGNAAVD
jgi:hypothetical protein